MSKGHGKKTSLPMILETFLPIDYNSQVPVVKTSNEV